MEREIEAQKQTMLLYQKDFDESKNERKKLLDKLQQCKYELKRLQSTNEQLQEENTIKQNELKTFVTKIVQRAEQWKHTFNAKKRQIRSLQAKTNPNQRYRPSRRLLSKQLKDGGDGQLEANENVTSPDTYNEAFLIKVRTFSVLPIKSFQCCYFLCCREFMFAMT